MDAGRYRLTLRQGPTPGKNYDLNREVLTIGRDVNNDVVINDAEVSRTHARLTLQTDGCLVEDLASTNGVFVNGQRITTPRLMRPGDMLGLSETVILRLELVNESLLGEAEPVALAETESFPVVPPVEDLAPPPPVARPSAKPAPAQPAAAPESPPNTTWRWIAIGCGGLLLLTCLTALAVFWYIDANNLYCQIAPSVFPGCR